MVMLVATFVTTPEAGNLSELLRQDYPSKAEKPEVYVKGPLARLRRRVPWSRPKEVAASCDVRFPHSIQREACESHMHDIERGAEAWLAKNFPGRFARRKYNTRPLLRIFLTSNSVPFSEQDMALQSLGLDKQFSGTWRATNGCGWAVASSRFGQDERMAILRAGARRSDAARSDINQAQLGDDYVMSNWSLVQRFHRYDSIIFCLWAIAATLDDYARQLAELRDRSALIGGPVKSAKTLGRFLLTDGLDIATIAGDIERHLPRDSRDLHLTREFIEDCSPTPAGRQAIAAPSTFVDVVHDVTLQRAERLQKDSSDLLSHLATHSQLLQAAANTRLQRLVITLTLSAVVVAVLSLILA